MPHKNAKCERRPGNEIAYDACKMPTSKQLERTLITTVKMKNRNKEFSVRMQRIYVMLGQIY